MSTYTEKIWIFSVDYLTKINTNIHEQRGNTNIYNWKQFLIKEWARSNNEKTYLRRDTYQCGEANKCQATIIYYMIINK
jgi:hypothetical protein